MIGTNYERVIKNNRYDALILTEKRLNDKSVEFLCKKHNYQKEIYVTKLNANKKQR